jgi:putative transposase
MIDARMPRIPRVQQAGFVYHVINRGNGRFKSFPVQRGEHLLMVLRYVVENPVRSGLAASVDDWPWSSWCRSELADPCPVEVEVNWLAQVDEPLSASQLASIRESVNRQRPFGESDWQTKIASQFGLEGADPR